MFESKPQSEIHLKISGTLIPALDLFLQKPHPQQVKYAKKISLFKMDCEEFLKNRIDIIVFFSKAGAIQGVLNACETPAFTADLLGENSLWETINTTIKELQTTWSKIREKPSDHLRQNSIDEKLTEFCRGSLLPMTASKARANIYSLINSPRSYTFNQWPLSDLLAIRYLFQLEEIKDFLNSQNTITQKLQSKNLCHPRLAAHIIEHFSEYIFSGILADFINDFNTSKQSPKLTIVDSELKITTTTSYKKIFIRMKVQLASLIIYFKMPHKAAPQYEHSPSHCITLEYYLSVTNDKVVCEDPLFKAEGSLGVAISEHFKRYIASAPPEQSVSREEPQLAPLASTLSPNHAGKYPCYYDDSNTLKNELRIHSASFQSRALNFLEIKINEQLNLYLDGRLKTEELVLQLSRLQNQFGQRSLAFTSISLPIIGNIISNHQKKLASFCLGIKQPAAEQLQNEKQTLEEYLLASSIRSLSTVTNHYNKFNNKAIDDLAQVFLSRNINDLKTSYNFLMNYFKMLEFKNESLVNHLILHFNQAAILGMFDPVVARCQEKSNTQVCLREVASTCYINQDTNPNKVQIQFTGYFQVTFPYKFLEVSDVPLDMPEENLAAQFSSIQFNYELWAEGENVSCRNTHYRVQGSDAAYLTQLLIDCINEKPIKVLSQATTPAFQARSRSNSAGSSTPITTDSDTTRTTATAKKHEIYKWHMFK